MRSMAQQAMPLHPATQKAHLRAFLKEHPVATTVQLGRFGLAEAVGWLKLPTVTYTCRTRARHEDSEHDLTFVALGERTLKRAPRELMHEAALTEMRVRLADEAPRLASYRWRTTTERGAARARRPDAELISGRPDMRGDYAVEIDAGYAGKVRRAKLASFDMDNYQGVIWGTTVHARTVTLIEEARALKLGKLRDLQVYYLNFWSPGDPYRDRPRCHKPMVTRW